VSEIEIVRVGSGRPELWLIAGVHGDEVEGMLVVEEALRTIRPDRGTLVGVPVAHPAALVAGTRAGIDGADLNRTYPGRADGRPSERVAHELWRQIEHARPDAFVTFHSWSRAGSATPYVEHALGDERSRDLARSLGLPFVEAWEWPAGLLGQEAKAFEIPNAELELYGLGRHSAEGLSYGLRAARGAAAWLGMIEAMPNRGALDVRRTTLTAPAAGRVVQLADLASAVEAGDPVAELRDRGGATSARLVAPEAGWIGVHVTYGQVNAGDPVAVVFVTREAELPTR
jgi:predicted deacylase